MQHVLKHADIFKDFALILKVFEVPSALCLLVLVLSAIKLY